MTTTILEIFGHVSTDIFQTLSNINIYMPQVKYGGKYQTHINSFSFKNLPLKTFYDYDN
jgi:hypothetical protein